MLECIKLKYDMGANCKTIFTDGSKMEYGKAVGVGVAILDNEIGYYININNKCSIYTAETLAIYETLKKNVARKGYRGYFNSFRFFKCATGNI